MPARCFAPWWDQRRGTLDRNVFFDFAHVSLYHYSAFPRGKPRSPDKDALEAMPEQDEALRALRREIDDIDEQLHELIVRRTQVIEKVCDLKRDQPVKVRAAREAQIAYRLVERHRGAFPKRDLLRIWRELIMATLGIEGPFSVAVYAKENEDAYWDLARDHFCLSLPMTRHGSAQQVITAVTRGDATAGVLPLPRIDDPEPWWPYLMGAGGERPRVIFRLPFAGRGNGREGHTEALVICPIEQEASGRDRSLFAFETEEPIPQGTIQATLTKCGLPPTMVHPRMDSHSGGTPLYLIEVDDYLAKDDARIDAFIEALKRPVGSIVLLGGYAKPLSDDELAPSAE